MTTGRDIVTKALQKLGVLVKSESAAADEAIDGQSALNAMVSSWANDALLIPAKISENFPLTAGVAEYTIGSGQTFNTVRPVFITEAHIRIGLTDYSLTPINDESYAAIPSKGDLGVSDCFNYMTGYPVGKIRLYPTPSISAIIYLQSEKALSAFMLDSDVTLPEGWERALVFNLAMDLAPDYGSAVNPTSLNLTAGIARESKAAIKTATLRNRTMDMPAATGGFDNFYTRNF